MTKYEAALLSSQARGGRLYALPGKHKDSGEDCVIICWIDRDGIVYPVCRLPGPEEPEKLAAAYTILGEKAVPSKKFNPQLFEQATEPA